MAIFPRKNGQKKFGFSYYDAIEVRRITEL